MYVSKLDLTNKTFGKLYVLRKHGTVSNQIQWLCRCECLNEVILSTHKLNGGTKSCGCYVKEKLQKNIQGITTSNGIYVIEKISTSKDRHVTWKCQCHCGKIFIAQGTRLTMNSDQAIKSCGCSKKKNKHE